MESAGLGAGTSGAHASGAGATQAGGVGSTAVKGTPERGTALTVFAICFALLALSNLSKTVFADERTGFVLFGIRLSGTANTIAALIAAAFLAFYARAIWQMKRYALPMGHFYATYVILNLFFYSMIHTRPPGAAYFLFMIVYTVIAVGVSAGAAAMLTKRKDELVG